MSRHASGLRAWYLQRISGLYLGGLTLYLLGLFILAPPADHAAWRALVAQPLMQVALLLGFAALLLHAWVGFRDVVIDYVHPTALRIGLLTLTAIGLLGCGFWALLVVLRPAISG